MALVAGEVAPSSGAAASCLLQARSAAEAGDALPAVQRVAHAMGAGSEVRCHCWVQMSSRPATVPGPLLLLQPGAAGPAAWLFVGGAVSNFQQTLACHADGCGVRCRLTVQQSATRQPPWTRCSMPGTGTAAAK
jgi:hypothetical protein